MKIGDLIGDKYEVVEIIGQNNHVTTAKCLNIYLGNEWLVKHCMKKNSEYDYLITLNHNRVPKVIDYIKRNEGYYYIMTSIPGITLDEYMKVKPIKFSLVIKWLLELIEILEHVHCQNIVHGDISKYNLLIDGQDSMYLIDFGGSFKDKDSNAFTAKYVAPERLLDYSQVDIKSDYFSVGILFMEVLECLDRYTFSEKMKYRKLKRLLNQLIQINPENRLDNLSLLSASIAKL